VDRRHAFNAHAISISALARFPILEWEADGKRSRYSNLTPCPRRFPPPWWIEDIGAAFVVKDARGHKLGYNPELFTCEAV